MYESSVDLVKGTYPYYVKCLEERDLQQYYVEQNWVLICTTELHPEEMGAKNEKKKRHSTGIFLYGFFLTYLTCKLLLLKFSYEKTDANQMSYKNISS